MIKGRTRFTMGRLLILLGIAVKMFQLCATIWEVSWAAGTVPTVISLCAFSGGLAVFAYERKAITSIFALGAAVLALAATLLEAGAADGGALSVLFRVCYLGVFFVYSFMLISLRHDARKIAGCCVLVLALVLTVHISGVISYPYAVLNCILMLEYVIMAVALFM